MTSYDTGNQLDVLCHYQVIRRNGAVVPFEPSKIANAMMKALLAVAGSAVGLALSITGAPQALFRRVSLWLGHIKHQARQCKTAMSGQAARMQQSTRDGLQLRVGSGKGFFSAAKPNLHNAP